jgi:hypothetical protein
VVEAVSGHLLYARLRAGEKILWDLPDQTLNGLALYAPIRAELESLDRACLNQVVHLGAMDTEQFSYFLDGQE